MSLFISQFSLFNSLQNIDRRVLLAINYAHSLALDAIMIFASNRLVWFPAYALLVGWLVYLFRRRVLLLLPLLITAVALSDSITSKLFKPFFGRLRPCHDAGVAPLLHLPDGCGGQFGFLSSHAANSVALAVFLALTLPTGRFRGLKITVGLWAAVLSYSRIYLGAHFPSDVLGGALVGALLGAGTALLFKYLDSRSTANPTCK